MKKKFTSLIGAVVVLVLLLGLYIYSSNNEGTENITEETDDTTINSVSIIEVENANEITINNNNSQYTINRLGEKCSIKGYENNSFAQSDMSYVFAALSDLNGEKVEANSSNMAKYGLEPPVATATIKGDNQVVLNVGEPTPDGKYQYVSINDDRNVFMITSGTANIVLRNMNELIERSVTTISASNVNYINIAEKGKPEILITNDNNNEALKNYVSTSGLSALVMTSPIDNGIVYPTNMQDTLLCNLSAMTIDSIVELNPVNLEKYGLSNPAMTVTIKDSNESFNIKVGDFADDNSVYVMINDKPEVYTVTKDLLDPFMNVNIMDFVQNFVSLYPRSIVDTVTIKTVDNEHKIEFKTEGENKIAVDEENVKRDNRNAYINGKLIPKEEFGDFYEALVGIGFDSVDYSNSINIQGEPEVVITFNFIDGSKDVINYYNYNDNFYFIKESNNNSALIVNKQQITQLIDYIYKLTQ